MSVIFIRWPLIWPQSLAEANEARSHEEDQEEPEETKGAPKMICSARTKCSHYSSLHLADDKDYLNLACKSNCCQRFILFNLQPPNCCTHGMARLPILAVPWLVTPDEDDNLTLSDAYNLDLGYLH